MSKNLDETVRLQSEKNRLQGLQRARVALPDWPAHQPRRSPGKTSVRGTHCSLIEQERRVFLPDLPEIEAKGKMEERTRWWGQSESQIEEKWQTCWCCQDHQRACKMAQTSAEKLEHIGAC